MTQSMVDGFYTRDEAARVLGVSSRTISRFLSQRKLRRVKRGRDLWIPKEDVDALYKETVASLPPSRAEHDLLVEEMHDMHCQIEVLKLGLGFATPMSVRSAKDSILLRQVFLDALAQPAWNNTVLSQLADALRSIREEEIQLLHDEFGPKGWAPFVDMMNRSLQFIENHPYFPGRGLDVLLERTLRARNSFYGMLHAARVVETPLPRRTATAVLKLAERSRSTTDVSIFEYAQRRAAEVQN